MSESVSVGVSERMSWSVKKMSRQFGSYLVFFDFHETRNAYQVSLQ